MQVNVPSFLRTARPVLQRRGHKATSLRFNSSKPASSLEGAQKKAQDALASTQKNAEKLMESSKKFLEQQNVAKVLDSSKKFLSPLGQRLGSLLGSYREPLLYNLAVGRELVKHVYRAESLQPPNSWATVTNAYKTLWSRASQPNYWRGIIRSGEIARVGIYALEAYGIFKIGEIIGRRSLVGYNVDTHTH